ncbi:MAG: multidrug ABC transporter substrate-binding protein [Nitrospirae bacterium GWC2_56_14]|nr:MAG: multidrug ABC transporter substrate-binding protein [Nitrospirae bacterium GWC2_56_14]
MLGNIIILALREIRRNVLRSFLTILGIIIGVAAVITMVTVGGSATAQIQQQIASMGSNLLMVMPGKRMGAGMEAGNVLFKEDDAVAIARDINSIAAVAPVSTRSLQAIFGNQNWTTQVTGSDNVFIGITNRAVKTGRQFTDNELRSGAAVCILGETVKTKLFGGQDAVGEKIRLQKLSCEVLGILEPKGQNTMGMDQDDVVIIPLKTLQRRVTGNQDVGVLYVSVSNNASTEKVQQELSVLMRERRHLSPSDDDNFNVMDMKEIAKMLTSTTQLLTALLSAVAAVSLLVGGIGIMNIMLVSVTERTREIGTRLAIGALEREVLLQFLIEAVVLSSLGGLLGIVLAMASSVLLTAVLNVPFIFNGSIIIISFLFSAAVGVIFGYMPAKKAARLNPIDALRYE